MNIKKIPYIIYMILIVAFVTMNFSAALAIKAETTDAADATDATDVTDAADATDATDATDDTDYIDPDEEPEYIDTDPVMISEGVYQIYVYEDENMASCNTREINSLLSRSDVDKIIIPSGKTVYLGYTLYLASNKTIEATGAEIIQTGNNDNNKKCGIFNNKPTETGYSSLKNVTINGGTWTTVNKDDGASLFRIAHAQNIKFENMTINYPYTGHGIELIGCKNCTIKKCTVYGMGTKKSSSVEEAIQIDIAEQHTAPGIYSYNKKYCNGLTCQNITIDTCKVRGCRGVCANYAAKGTAKMKCKYHSNIKIMNCTIEGMTAEAVALFNTKSATIKNNRMRSKTTRSGCYSVGLNITIIGKSTAYKSGTISISNNKISGCRNAIQVISVVSPKKYRKNKSYIYKSVTVKSNKVYAKSGAKNAINISAAKKKTVSKNSTKKWSW